MGSTYSHDAMNYCYYTSENSLNICPHGLKTITGNEAFTGNYDIIKLFQYLLKGESTVEYNGQTVNIYKEDTNNINNGLPILWWE